MQARPHSVDARFRLIEHEPIRVAIADDHAGLRRSLKLLLEREEDMDMVGEAADLQATLHLVTARRPAVLVLDIGIPGGSAVEIIERLREQAPRTELVVITMHEHRVFADQFLEAGALGCVLKDRADTELCDSVRDAARGVQYRSPSLGGPYDREA